MQEYDVQLLKDIKEGRTDTLEKVVVADEGYSRLAERQKEEWKKLEGMGLSVEVLEAFSDYTELCASQTAKYVDLMYEFGVQDGLHLGRM